MTWFQWLSGFFQALRVFKNARERRLQERQADREQLVELIETLFDRLERLEEHRTQAAVAAASAQTAQADALRTWFDMFKHDSTDSSPLPTVRSVDEFDAERSRERERLLELGYPLDGTPEEQMAFLQSIDWVMNPLS